MDTIDRQIVRALLADSQRSIADIGISVNLSASACHRRIKILEEAGIITGYIAQVDPLQLGFAAEVFVEISLESQSEESLRQFEKAVFHFEEILGCYLMAGSADYLLRVAARDISDYERIHRNCLAKLPAVSRMRSSFILRTIKNQIGYPMHH